MGRKRPNRERLKRAAARGLLLLASLAFVYLLLEFFLFQHLLAIMPLKTTWRLDEGLRVLVQSSKDGIVPEDYIALVGDSYAEGKGDWFGSVNKNLRPDFHSAHVLHDLTGRDVISFGASGAGSLRAVVGEPIARYEFVNSRTQFSLEPPAVILVYFYEGNDLNNNLQDLRSRFHRLRDEERVYEERYFDGFIEEVVHRGDPLFARARAGGRPLFFLREVAVRHRGGGGHRSSSLEGRRGEIGPAEPGSREWTPGPHPRRAPVSGAGA
jgi:hypothetical protein